MYLCKYVCKSIPNAAFCITFLTFQEPAYQVFFSAHALITQCGSAIPSDKLLPYPASGALLRSCYFRCWPHGSFQTHCNHDASGRASPTLSRNHVKEKDERQRRRASPQPSPPLPQPPPSLRISQAPPPSFQHVWQPAHMSEHEEVKSRGPNFCLEAT